LGKGDVKKAAKSKGNKIERRHCCVILSIPWRASRTSLNRDEGFLLGEKSKKDSKESGGRVKKEKKLAR